MENYLDLLLYPPNYTYCFVENQNNSNSCVQFGIADVTDSAAAEVTKNICFETCSSYSSTINVTVEIY